MGLPQLSGRASAAWFYGDCGCCSPSAKRRAGSSPARSFKADRALCLLNLRRSLTKDRGQSRTADLREISDPNGGGWQRWAAVGWHDRSTSRWCGATALLSLRPRARRAAARGCPQAPAGLLLGTRAIGSAPLSPPKVRAHLSSHSHSHCWRVATLNVSAESTADKYV